MIDVVMLTNTADADIFALTCDALKSLFDSEIDRMFRVILMESNGQFYGGHPSWNYTKLFPVELIQYRGDGFNYNRALNQAFDHLDPSATHVVVTNNDVHFHKNWANRLIACMDRYHLHVGSPFAPGWPPHERNFTDEWEVYIGTRTSFEVAGWCFCIRKEALDAIRPFDERFCFEFQDVDMVDQLIAAGYGRMGLVRSSMVTHYLNQSHRLIENRQGMIEGARDVYLEKQNERPST